MYGPPENVILYPEVMEPMSDRKTEPQGTAVSDTEEVTDAGVSLEELSQQLEAELKKVAPDDLAAARKQVDDLLEGDLKWADLMEWTPERLHETAKEGYRQYEAAKYAQAEVIFKGLTVLDPDNFYYHQMLAASFQQQQKYPEAIVEYSIAVDLNPEDITSFTNRGEVYFELKLWDLADVDFDRAVSLDPAGQDRWANRSRLLKKKVTAIRNVEQAGPATKETK